MKKQPSFIITGALALVMLFVMQLSACAQDVSKDALRNTTPQQRADMQTQMMKKELNLTDTQYTAVSKLNLEYAQKMQPVLASGDGRMAKAMKAKSIMKEKDKKLKAILTEEQYNRYEEVIKEKIKKLKEMKKD